MTLNKRHFSRRTVICSSALFTTASFVIVLCVCVGFHPRLTSVWLHCNSYSRLTVEESLGAVFIPSAGGVGRFQASSSAVPYLHKMIKDGKFKEYHRNAILQFVFAGGEKEVDLLENYVTSLKGTVPTNNEQQVLRAIPHVLGHMAIRDVRGADALLRRMCDREYWTALEFSFSPEQVDEAVFRSVQGCAIGRLPDVAQLAAKTLSEIDDPVRQDRVESNVAVARLREYVAGSEFRVWFWISQSHRDYYRRCFNGDLEHPGPSNWALEKRGSHP